MISIKIRSGNNDVQLKLLSLGYDWVDGKEGVREGVRLIGAGEDGFLYSLNEEAYRIFEGAEITEEALKGVRVQDLHLNSKTIMVFRPNSWGAICSSCRATMKIGTNPNIIGKVSCWKCKREYEVIGP